MSKENEKKPSDLEVAEKIYQKGVSGDMVSKDVVVDGITQAISEARAEGRLDPPSLKVTHVKKLLDEARREEAKAWQEGNRSIKFLVEKARREEGEIVHKQMDEIMDKAIERARREERKVIKEKLCEQCKAKFALSAK